MRHHPGLPAHGTYPVSTIADPDAEPADDPVCPGCNRDWVSLLEFKCSFCGHAAGAINRSEAKRPKH